MNSTIVLKVHGTYGLKPLFQKLLRPIARSLAGAGIRANQVTLASAVLSVGLGTFLLTSSNPRSFLWLAPGLLARMALNAIDGMIAREFDQATPLGVYLNELGDAISDIFLILPLAHVDGFSPFWIWIVVSGALISELTGVTSTLAGASRRYDGPMGKSDRAVVLAALGLWIGFAEGVPDLVARFLPPTLTALLILTVAFRVKAGIQQASCERNPNASL